MDEKTSEILEEELANVTGGGGPTKNNYSADCAIRTKPEAPCNNNAFDMWCDHFRRTKYGNMYRHYCMHGSYFIWSTDEHGRNIVPAPPGWVD